MSGANHVIEFDEIPQKLLKPVFPRDNNSENKMDFGGVEFLFP